MRNIIIIITFNEIGEIIAIKLNETAGVYINFHVFHLGNSDLFVK